MKQVKRILLVEDDENLSLILKDNLEDLNFEVKDVQNGEDAILLSEKENFDLILMDVELSGILNGFETAEVIRKKHLTLPIIFTTAKKSSDDIERGFSIGYMDYLKKPFGVKELSLRINALLDVKKPEKVVFQLGFFQFNPTYRTLNYQTEDHRLTKQEAQFLTLLCENSGNIVYKEDLINYLWENDDDPKSKEGAINNIAYNLRKYLKRDSSILLETIPKGGYRIIVNSGKLKD
jgi:two-component system, OmpR family, response regulator TrcR